MNLAKLVSLSIALLFIQACSHPIEIEGQGDVTSQSGNRNCSLDQFTAADPVCSQNLAIGAYQETYNPVPRAGWKFDHWANYCTNATGPNYDCVFNIPAATVQKYWFQTMPPLKAVFLPIGDTDGDGLNDDVDPCPANPTNPCALITGNDIVIADGKEWAQPALFIGLSWNQIIAACPYGVSGCLDGAILNGRDMTGWTWAGISHAAALFNSYGVSPPLSTQVPDEISLAASTWAPAFFADGWTPTALTTGTYNNRYMYATLQDSFDTEFARMAWLFDRGNPAQADIANTASTIYKPYAGDPTIGALFYRQID